jgi:hypothetical protein
MFRLLSKESNIFSIPFYIGILLLIVISFNILDFNTLELISALITFAGVALGYFCINAIALNYQSHLPLFLYTVFIFAFYPGDLDLGIAISLFTNSIILLLLTTDDLSVRNTSYILVGAILCFNFVFLPTTWPMAIFVIFHIIGTSDRLLLNLFRLFFGIFLVAISYLSMAYYFHLNSWNADYFPFHDFTVVKNFDTILWLSPVVLMLIYSMMDHFQNFNKKSPTSRFKYTFLLVFSLAQMITVILYMGKTFEYLLLLALPASIIISRMLKFRRRYWVKEISLWIIIASLLLFKLSTYFNFY